MPTNQPKGRRPWPASPKGGMEVVADVRLRCVEVVQNRALKAGQVMDMEAVIENAKKLEEYVLG